jgi:hypothetical protein
MRKSSGSLGGGTDLATMRRPGELVDVGSKFGDEGEVKSAKIVRTGRRLMKGAIWYSGRSRSRLKLGRELTHS